MANIWPTRSRNFTDVRVLKPGENIMQGRADGPFHSHASIAFEVT